jgi:putative acetyltransferase
MDPNIRSFKLRPSLGADRDAIVEIWHSSASLPGVGPAEMPAPARLRERLDHEIATGWVVTVAVSGTEVVGFLAISPRESLLDEIFVRPGWIGRGIGNALLSHAKTAMPTGFTLHTRQANLRARRFYEKAGLVHLHDGVHPRNGDPIAYYGWNGADRDGPPVSSDPPGTPGSA